MKKYLIWGIGALIVLSIGVFVVVFRPIHSLDQTVCTADAMLCPDGSYVGRSGPQCQFEQCPNGGVVPADGDVTIAIGKTAVVGGLSLTLNSFIQDNRCPVDVVCIEAGAVTVNVTMKDSSKSETRNFPSDEVPYEFDGYKISIVDINPPARSTVEIKDTEYRITFHVQKINISTARGTLTGHITISPTCPVERIPPDPNCAPKSYSTLVDISGAHNFFIEVHTDSNGVYKLELPEGTYTVLTRQTSLYPHCEPKQVSVVSHATTTLDISCDSGIR